MFLLLLAVYELLAFAQPVPRVAANYCSLPEPSFIVSAATSSPHSTSFKSTVDTNYSERTLSSGINGSLVKKI
jgi:hypothetical protein